MLKKELNRAMVSRAIEYYSSIIEHGIPDDDKERKEYLKKMFIGNGICVYFEEKEKAHVYDHPAIRKFIPEKQLMFTLIPLKAQSKQHTIHLLRKRLELLYLVKDELRH